MNIDFHNHFFPKPYLEELKRGRGYATVGMDSEGRTLIYYRGDYNIVVGPHIDVDKRLEAMDRYDIDMQVLTLTTPGVEREETERGIRLARVVNDAFSEIGKAPSGYLRRVWVDSLCYNRDVFMCAYSLLGPKRIVLGSDFPHQIGDIERAVGRIRDLDIPEEDKRKILGENAQELLGL